MRSVFCRLSGWLGSLVLVLVAALGSPSAEAQTVPSNCRPTGTYYDCVSRIPMAYSYAKGACPPGAFATEAGAFAAYRQSFQGAQCTPTFITGTWISASAPKLAGVDFIPTCYGGSYWFPRFAWEFEAQNYKLETVIQANNPPACTNPVTSVWGAVYRDRPVNCPEGYTSYTGSACYRASTTAAATSPK